MALTVATWNVERVRKGSWKKRPAQQAAMAAIDADVWVLTETSTWHEPAPGFHAVHCPPHPAGDADERMVSIWSRWPLAPTGLEPRARGAVSAVAETPEGPVTVFGSVIPYAHDHGPDGDLRLWQSHYQEIERLAGEWAALAVGGALVVAGDLNQDRDGSGWYGTKRGRALLTEAFATAGLVCHTEQDVDALGVLPGHHLIDHIASTAQLQPAGPLIGWPPVAADGTRMSDHPGIALSLGDGIPDHVDAHLHADGDGWPDGAAGPDFDGDRTPDAEQPFLDSDGDMLRDHGKLQLYTALELWNAR